MKKNPLKELFISGQKAINMQLLERLDMLEKGIKKWQFDKKFNPIMPEIEKLAKSKNWAYGYDAGRLAERQRILTIIKRMRSEGLTMDWLEKKLTPCEIRLK